MVGLVRHSGDSPNPGHPYAADTHTRQSHLSRHRSDLVQAGALSLAVAAWTVSPAFAGPVPSFQGLGDLPGGSSRSEAKATSTDSMVVVGRGSSASRLRAFLWGADEGGRSSQDLLASDFGLDLMGWQLTDATGLSADGITIVGIGVNPSGDAEAWVASVPLCAFPADTNDEDLINADGIQGFVDCLVAAGANCACADVESNPDLDIDDVAVFVKDLLAGLPCP